MTKTKTPRTRTHNLAQDAQTELANTGHTQLTKLASRYDSIIHKGYDYAANAEVATQVHTKTKAYCDRKVAYYDDLLATKGAEGKTAARKQRKALLALPDSTSAVEASAKADAATAGKPSERIMTSKVGSTVGQRKHKTSDAKQERQNKLRGRQIHNNRKTNRAGN